MADHDVKAEMDKLKEELAKLRSDIAGVTEALKGAGAAKAEQVKESSENFFAHFKEGLLHAMDDAREKSKKTVEVVEHKVAEHPFITILAAFGVGFLIGKLIDKNHK